MITILFILLKEVRQLYFHSLENRKKNVEKIDTNVSLEHETGLKKEA